MKEFKGTKDWKLGSDRNNKEFKESIKTDFDVISINVDGHKGHIMLFGDNNEEHKANAKLIAAAPELLEALKVFVNFPKEDLEGWIDEGTPVTMTVQSEDLYRALKAINKAIS
jgi:hypothetical protein|tara:strand:- start:5739 stop:6077 length:339 start_codon:yes stop_codon:yes gene_type:complete